MDVEDTAESASLVEILQHLDRIQEPSELIYRQDALLSANPPPHGIVEEYSVTVARRVSTILSRLSRLADPQSLLVMTPRAVLLALMDIVRHGLLMGLPDGMRHVGRDIDSHAAAFHLYISSRRVPIASMAEGLHTITYVSVKLRFEMVMLQLRARLEEEMRAATKEEELAALLVTETLLEDFVVVYNNVLLTIPAGRCISVPQASMLLPTIIRYYYQLGDWVMCTANVSSVSPLSLTRVTRVSCDDEKGVVDIELRRPAPDTPWGLLFNEKSRLIGMDVSMRVHDKARELHALLRCTQTGATIVAVNETPVRASDLDFSHEALTAIHDASVNRKRIKLTAKAAGFKAAIRNVPVEVAFSLPPQGGEGASGQRASLLLHRLAAEVPWRFSIDEHLHWIHPPLAMLSDECKSFVRQYSRRLRLLAVNGVEIFSAPQAVELVQQVEAVLLELVVLPPSKDHNHDIVDLDERNNDPSSTQCESTTKAVRASHSVDPEHMAAIQQQVLEAAYQPLPEGARASALESAAVDTASSTFPTVETVKRPRKKVAAASIEPVVQVVSTDDNNQTIVAVPTSAETPENITESVDPGCVFSNDVELLSISDTEMQLRRPSVDQPWGLHISKSMNPDASPGHLPLRLLKLPELRSATEHPFLRIFQQVPDTWYIASVNGKSAKDVAAVIKDMSRLTRMTLQFLRR